jgi:heme A synthase
MRVPSRAPDRSERRRFGLAAAGLLVVGAAGAITALGDTLFPADSLLEGIRDDFTGTFLVRLRWIHPIVAVAVSVLLIRLAQLHRPTTNAGSRLSDLLTGLVVIQLIAGVVNVLLLAPVWMQVVHLLLADALWITFVLFSTEAIAERAVERARAPLPS